MQKRKLQKQLLKKQQKKQPPKGGVLISMVYTKGMKIPDFRSDLQRRAEKELQSFGRRQGQNYGRFKKRWADKRDKGVGQYEGYNPFKKY